MLESICTNSKSGRHPSLGFYHNHKPKHKNYAYTTPCCCTMNTKKALNVQALSSKLPGSLISPLFLVTARGLLPDSCLEVLMLESLDDLIFG